MQPLKKQVARDCGCGAILGCGVAVAATQKMLCQLYCDQNIKAEQWLGTMIYYASKEW